MPPPGGIFINLNLTITDMYSGRQLYSLDRIKEMQNNGALIFINDEYQTTHALTDLIRSRGSSFELDFDYTPGGGSFHFLTSKLERS